MAEERKEHMRWYVLRAIGGRERKVCQYFENEVARLHYEDYVPTVLVPMEKVYQIRNGKKVSKERVFFPGYVFVEALLTGEIPHFLTAAPDVLGFLNDPSGEPAPLSPAEVNRLLGKMDELSEDGESMEVPFSIGDVVRVVDGPFNTFSGIVSEVNEDKKKLTVIVKIFERKTPLELGFMQVEKE
ncbi:MAG: transcription termination/antitermination factor NusG [Bacteroidetes bacterium]|nr:MAG: transcription termination/antitermination factor NusG [Bacteroidota bacterium]